MCKPREKWNWAASSEFGTYRLCEQRRFRRACASAQSRQNLRCSLIQAMSQEEPSDRKPDPWPLWMAGHAQLKFFMMECSKTQIRLMRPNWSAHQHSLISVSLLIYLVVKDCKQGRLRDCAVGRLIWLLTHTGLFGSSEPTYIPNIAFLYMIFETGVENFYQYKVWLFFLFSTGKKIIHL